MARLDALSIKMTNGSTAEKLAPEDKRAPMLRSFVGQTGA